MNTPNVPDEIWLGKNEYSIWTDWKVNGWLFIATIISCASDIIFPHIVRQWPLTLRAAVAVAPFVVIPLWMHSLARWIRGMDELHRRITLAAVLFTTSATFFVILLWHRLDRAGLFQAIFPGNSNAGVSWDIATAGHAFLLLTFFYFLGYRIFNRRYQ